MTSLPVTPRDQEVLRLVERDYEETGNFIRGVVGTSATLRGWSVTIWLGLIGFAFDRQLYELAVLAALVTFAFAIIDAYHARLYVQALTHASRLERVVSAYYTVLTLGEDDEDAIDDFRDEVDALRLGLYSNFRSQQAGRREPRVHRRVVVAVVGLYKLLHEARPRVFFSLLYPALFVGAVGVAVGIAVD